MDVFDEMDQNHQKIKNFMFESYSSVLKWPQLNSTHKNKYFFWVSEPLLTYDHKWPIDQSNCRFFFSKCLKPHINSCIFLDTWKTIEDFSKMVYACIYIPLRVTSTWSWPILTIWWNLTIFKINLVPKKRCRQIN